MCAAIGVAALAGVAAAVRALAWGLRLAGIVPLVRRLLLRIAGLAVALALATGIILRVGVLRIARIIALVRRFQLVVRWILAGLAVGLGRAFSRFLALRALLRLL